VYWKTAGSLADWHCKQCVASTFKSVTASLVEKVLLVTRVRDVSHTLLDDLAEREDTKLTMAGLEIAIVASLVRWVVDMTYNLGPLRENRSVFGQFLSPYASTMRGVVRCRRSALRFHVAVLTTTTTGRVKKRLDVHSLGSDVPFSVR
jgi:hypothetical protein